MDSAIPRERPVDEEKYSHLSSGGPPHGSQQTLVDDFHELRIYLPPSLIVLRVFGVSLLVGLEFPLNLNPVLNRVCKSLEQSRSKADAHRATQGSSFFNHRHPHRYTEDICENLWPQETLGCSTAEHHLLGRYARKFLQYLDVPVRGVDRALPKRSYTLRLARLSGIVDVKIHKRRRGVLPKPRVVHSGE